MCVRVGGNGVGVCEWVGVVWVWENDFVVGGVWMCACGCEEVGVVIGMMFGVM